MVFAGFWKLAVAPGKARLMVELEAGCRGTKKRTHFSLMLHKAHGLTCFGAFVGPFRGLSYAVE